MHDDRAPPRVGERALEVFPVRDGPAVDVRYHVTRLDAGRRSWAAFDDATDDGGPDRTAERRKHDHEDDDGEDEVHPRPGEHDEKARPQRLEGERLGGIVGQRLAALHGTFLAHHLHVAAHGNERQTVLGFLAAPTQQHRTEADRKALHTDTGEPGHDEVPELVHEDQYADDDDEAQHHDEDVNCDCHGLPPERASIHSRTRRRARASTSTHSSMDPSSRAGSAPSARSIDCVISGNPMRRSRKAATAISLAAFRITGAAPPASRAARARRSAGKRSGSGASNVSGPVRVRSSRDEGVGRRSGNVSAYRIGMPMSATPSCASTEPSMYSTMECTIDCGCITTCT